MSYSCVEEKDRTDKTGLEAIISRYCHITHSLVLMMDIKTQPWRKFVIINLLEEDSYIYTWKSACIFDRTEVTVNMTNIWEVRAFLEAEEGL